MCQVTGNSPKVNSVENLEWKMVDTYNTARLTSSRMVCYHLWLGSILVQQKLWNTLWTLGSFPQRALKSLQCNQNQTAWFTNITRKTRPPEGHVKDNFYIEAECDWWQANITSTSLSSHVTLLAVNCIKKIGHLTCVLCSINKLRCKEKIDSLKGGGK